MKGKGCLDLVIKTVITSAVTCGVMFLEAQFIIWGLSLHISSGIWPVWLIGCGFEGILGLGVASGIRAVKNDD